MSVPECKCKLYLEAKEELADRVTNADALLRTGTPPQLVYDDQGPVTYIVDYVRDLWGEKMQSIIISQFSPLMHVINNVSSSIIKTNIPPSFPT